MNDTINTIFICLTSECIYDNCSAYYHDHQHLLYNKRWEIDLLLVVRIIPILVPQNQTQNLVRQANGKYFSNAIDGSEADDTIKEGLEYVTDFF